jgi:hypothetical protein
MDKKFRFRNIYCDTGELAADYEAYLQTRHWLELRLRIYELRKHACQRCHKQISVYQVHHVNYIRLGKERDSDVQLVCVKCHEIIHKRKDRLLAKKHLARKRRVREIKAVRKSSA